MTILAFGRVCPVRQMAKVNIAKSKKLLNLLKRVPLTLSPPLVPYGAMRTDLKKKFIKKSTVHDYRLKIEYSTCEELL